MGAHDDDASAVCSNAHKAQSAVRKTGALNWHTHAGVRWAMIRVLSFTFCDLLRGRCGAGCTGEVGAIEAAATAAGEDGSVLQRAENWAGSLKDPRHANKTGGG